MAATICQAFQKPGRYSCLSAGTGRNHEMRRTASFLPYLQRKSIHSTATFRLKSSGSPSLLPNQANGKSYCPPIAKLLSPSKVRIVVDSGLCRKLVYDARTGLTISKPFVSVRTWLLQRRGRAGRITSGVCYRLWTQTSEHLMPEQRLPEILDADLFHGSRHCCFLAKTNRNCCLGFTLPPKGNLPWPSNF